MNNVMRITDYSHILWDFNGTLLNDVEVGIKTINTLLTRRKMNTVDSVLDYHKAFCFPIINYYRNLNFDLQKESFNDIATEWVKEYLINVVEAPLYEGVTDLLASIKDNKITQLILSATEKDMLINQVNGLGITEYFEDMLGLDNIHAYSKVDIGKSWKEQVKPQKILMFGDTTHDYEVAMAIGAECILIANGHQSKETLCQCGAVVVDSIRAIQEKMVV